MASIPARGKSLSQYEFLDEPIVGPAEVPSSPTPTSPFALHFPVLSTGFRLSQGRQINGHVCSFSFSVICVFFCVALLGATQKQPTDGGELFRIFFKHNLKRDLDFSYREFEVWATTALSSSSWTLFRSWFDSSCRVPAHAEKTRGHHTRHARQSLQCAAAGAFHLRQQPAAFGPVCRGSQVQQPHLH